MIGTMHTSLQRMVDLPDIAETAETIIARSDSADWVLAFAASYCGVPAQLDVRLHYCLAYSIKLLLLEDPYFGTYTDILRRWNAPMRNTRLPERLIGSTC